MSCDHWVEALSAMADGEDPGVEPRLVEAHLRTCSQCRAFADATEQMMSPTRLGEAPVMPDLSRRVVKAAVLADRASRWSIVRVVLGVVAVQIVVLAVPDLVRTSGTAAHESRHLGAFSVAYAVGLAMVVLRPARARTMLPVAAVLAGAIAITAVIDVVDGRVPLLDESLHLPELISVGLVWALAAPWGRRTEVRSVGRTPRLRLADDQHTRHEEQA